MQSNLFGLHNIFSCQPPSIAKVEGSKVEEFLFFYDVFYTISITPPLILKILEQGRRGEGNPGIVRNYIDDYSKLMSAFDCLRWLSTLELLLLE